MRCESRIMNIDIEDMQDDDRTGVEKETSVPGEKSSWFRERAGSEWVMEMMAEGRSTAVGH